jgi:hypothetical protein
LGSFTGPYGPGAVILNLRKPGVTSIFPKLGERHCQTVKQALGPLFSSRRNMAPLTFVRCNINDISKIKQGTFNEIAKPCVLQVFEFGAAVGTGKGQSP